MHKAIPGNSQYKISLTCEIIDYQNNIINLPILNNKIFIEIYGKKLLVDLIWLSLYSHFEIYLPKEYQDKVLTISFQKTNSKVTNSFCGSIMVFKKPLTYCNDYRVIPCFTDLAISKFGELIDIRTKRIIPRFNRGKLNYPEVFIYSPDKSKYSHIKIHRLVGLAWCPNDDFDYKSIINHKDSNKQNFHANNLEWVSFSRNSIHAYEQGKRTDNTPCKIRNFITKEIKTFISLNEAGTAIGLNYPVTLDKPLGKPRLYAGRYEIKTLDDESPWYYARLENSITHGKYTILAKNPNAEIEYFYNVRDFINHYKLWNLPSKSISEAMKVAIDKFPNIYFSYIENFHYSPYECKNLLTNEVKQCLTIAELSEFTKVNTSDLSRHYREYEYFIKKNFVFRRKSNNTQEWDMSKAHIKKKPIYVFKNLETNETRKFTTIALASKEYRIDDKTIRKRIITEEPYKGFSITREYVDK